MLHKFSLAYCQTVVDEACYLSKQSNSQLMSEVLVHFYRLSLDYCLNQTEVEALTDCIDENLAMNEAGVTMQQLLDDVSPFGLRVGGFFTSKSRRGPNRDSFDEEEAAGWTSDQDTSVTNKATQETPN